MDKVMEMLKTVFCAALFAGIGMSLFAADVSINENTAQPKSAVSPSVSFVQNLSDVLKTSSVDDALALFSNMPKSIEGDVQLKKIQVSLLISAGKYDDATQAISALEAKTPSDIELKELKMVVAKASGKSAVKSAVIKEIIAIDPNNAAANIELGAEQVLRHKYTSARNYYMKALKGDPNNTDALFGVGQTFYYLNDLKRSRQSFEKVLLLDPENSLAYSYISKLDAEAYNYKGAEANLQKAISLDDTNPVFYLELGTYQRLRGKYKEAEEAWTKAIELEPNNFLGYAYRAGLFDEQDIYDRALKDYRMVIKTNPDYYFAYEAIGILAWRAENYNEAAAAFDKASAVNDKNVSYPLMVAACYYKANKAAQVKPYLAKAMKKFTDRGDLDYLMLRLYHDLGPGNAENQISQKLQNETSRAKKGKMTFYLALYDEIKERTTVAEKLYAEVAAIQEPMFFEYRLAEWKVK